MHCPVCGQQQVNDATRFCSRCGFNLALIPELIANGGTLPQLAELYNKPNTFWTKKNGVFVSLMFMFIMMFLITSMLAVLDFDNIVPLTAILGLFGGIAGVILALFFLPSSKAKSPQFAINRQTQMAGAKQGYGELPPQQSIPAEQYIQPGHWKAPDTDQLIKQGSVTDSTTKLLERDTE